MINFKKLSELVNKYNSFILTSHVNPDPDALGSVLALDAILKKLNKKSKIIIHNEVPYNLKFMDKKNIIKKYDKKRDDKIINKYEALIVLDLNDLRRTASMENVLENFLGIKICIDHHEFPKDFMDEKFIDIKYSSTGAIIFDFIQSTDLRLLDKYIAEMIYAAIMTDTGSFRFNRTTAQTHRDVAVLLEKGVNPRNIYDQIYEQNNISKLKLLGEAISTLKLIHNDEIAYITVSQAMVKKYNSKEEETDGFVNYCLATKGVKMGILFYELADGLKISFRSKGDYAVNKLAKIFEGGGHLNAAGARLFNVDFDDTVRKVLEITEKFLNNKKDK